MADKKISALSQVADADIGADDLLHIVDNPGGTPVNKKMTIGQIFENIPTHLAVDDIAVVTTSATNLASTFATDFNLAGASGNITPTLDNGTDTGQLKVMYCFGTVRVLLESAVSCAFIVYSTSVTTILPSSTICLEVITFGVKVAVYLFKTAIINSH